MSIINPHPATPSPMPIYYISSPNGWIAPQRKSTGSKIGELKAHYTSSVSPLVLGRARLGTPYIASATSPQLTPKFTQADH